MATTSEQIAALELEAAQITLAISHILAGGQSYTIKSASGGGTERTVSMADYKTLVNHRPQIQADIAALNKNRGVSVTAAW